MATKLALTQSWEDYPAFTVLVLCREHAKEAKRCAIPESVCYADGDRCDVCEFADEVRP